MRTRTAALALLAAAAGCATATGRAPPPLPPLGAEAEVHVYLLPLAREAERLSFSLEGVALRGRDGAEVPLQLAGGDVSGEAPRQQLLAWGRVPPGDYQGLVVTAESAALAGARTGERAQLVLEPAATRPDLGFRAVPGQAIVLWAKLEVAKALSGDFGFSPVLGLSVAPQTPPLVAVYCTARGSASVTVMDRRSRLLTGVTPSGPTPHGIALAGGAGRAFVALSDADQIQVLDVASNAAVGQVRLAPGDGPRELAFAADGMLVVVNARSQTVAFVEPVALAEVGRVTVGDSPSDLLVDRSGRRAYVANRGSATVTVIDTGQRAVVGTLATEPEPVGVALSRDASRLYVVHKGSPSIGVFAIPSLTALPSVHVGLGVVAVKVDPRTDLVYLARADGVITVHDPLSLQPVERLDLPAEVTRMAIDDTENTLLALMPGRRSIAVLDLTSRKLLAEIPVGADPFRLAFHGERN